MRQSELSSRSAAAAREMSAAEARHLSLESQLASAQQGYLELRTRLQDGEQAQQVLSWLVSSNRVCLHER